MGPTAKEEDPSPERAVQAGSHDGHVLQGPALVLSALLHGDDRALGTLNTHML